MGSFFVVTHKHLGVLLRLGLEDLAVRGHAAGGGREGPASGHLKGAARNDGGHCEYLKTFDVDDGVVAD